MKTSEPQPRMPKPKLYLYLVLLLFAAVLAIFVVVHGVINEERRTAVVISTMMTLFILSAVELIPEVARCIGERSKAAKFRRFFGDAASKDDVRLVFAHRHLNPNLKADPFVTYYPAQGTGDKRVAEGAHFWLATQDVRAAVYVSSMLFKFTDRDVKFIHDKDIEQDDFDFCAISLGLGFNGFTRRLAGWCDDQLFEIKWGKSVKPAFPALTDFFAVGKGTIPVPPTNKDDCIVARVVPRTEAGKPQRVCFVCAGRTAPGTAAAGFYLAKNWPKLLALYERQNKDLTLDSLVVVVRHVAETSGAQEYDSTGVIATTGDAQVLEWGRVAGVG
jgi:hypothetical protein